jgi:uncharacterized protein (TIGR00251 family)
MYITVTVTPDARREIVEKVSDDTYSIAVREPAQRNLANKRVVALIAEQFKVPAHHTRIIAGHRSRKKIISIETTL